MFKMKKVISIAVFILIFVSICLGLKSLLKPKGYNKEIGELSMDLGKTLYKRKLVEQQSFKKADSVYEIDKKKILNEIYK